MRREGRQHGLVKTYRILPPPLNPRLVNSSTSPSTSALFTKLPSKQTKAHRKAWSAQVHWLRSNDIASSSYEQLTWRVLTGPRPVLNLPGSSDLNGNVNDCDESEDKGEEAEVETMKREDEHNSDKEDGGSLDDDESMSFYDVGMMMEHVLDDDEEDGWCLV